MANVTVKHYNGAEMRMKTKVVPRVGDRVTVEGSYWGDVEHVTCVFDRSEGDSYVVTLGPKVIR